MSKPVTIAKAAALAGVIAFTAVAQVQAQPVGPYTAQSSRGYYYDPCRRDTNQRGTAGGLIGAGIGAVIGSNAAARNARTEGAVLGGLLGAVIGNSVGNKTAACRSSDRTSSPTYRSDNGYYSRDAYADSAAAQAREDAYRYDQRDDRRDERDRREDRGAAGDGCTLAESPILMPDGRTQTRFVRVCRDASGRYAVVD